MEALMKSESGRIESFEDLVVWQKAVDVADLVLEMTEHGPLSRRFRLSDQVGDAAASISANIAEGHDGGSRKIYLKHLYIARGSSAETLTFLRIISRRNYVPLERINAVCSLLAEVRRMLNALINRLAVPQRTEP
jgi:four helix bundle protein